MGKRAPEHSLRSNVAARNQGVRGHGDVNIASNHHKQKYRLLP
jgi:hypothetical protein